MNCDRCGKRSWQVIIKIVRSFRRNARQSHCDRLLWPDSFQRGWKRNSWWWERELKAQPVAHIQWNVLLNSYFARLWGILCGFFGYPIWGAMKVSVGSVYWTATLGQPMAWDPYYGLWPNAGCAKPLGHMDFRTRLTYTSLMPDLFCQRWAESHGLRVRNVLHLFNITRKKFVRRNFRRLDSTVYQLLSEDGTSDTWRSSCWEGVEVMSLKIKTAINVVRQAISIQNWAKYNLPT